MKNAHTFLAGAISLCMVLLVNGCGNGGVKGGGTVSFSDGTLLDRGTVVFSNAQHQYTGTIQSDGTFNLGGLKPGDGLPPGTYRVAVTDVYDGETPILDVKYESPESSGITFEVVAGKKEPFKITVERSRTSRAPALDRPGFSDGDR